MGTGLQSKVHGDRSSNSRESMGTGLRIPVLVQRGPMEWRVHGDRSSNSSSMRFQGPGSRFQGQVSKVQVPISGTSNLGQSGGQVFKVHGRWVGTGLQSTYADRGYSVREPDPNRMSLRRKAPDSSSKSFVATVLLDPLLPHLLYDGNASSSGIADQKSASTSTSSSNVAGRHSQFSIVQ
jgi:hypothetical protein